MRKCPKCGFANDQNTLECPKCGAIYAKVQQAMASKQAIRQHETLLNQKIRKEMSDDFPIDETIDLWNAESNRDNEAYPVAAALSTFFAFAAAAAGIFCFIGALQFWGLLTHMSFFTDRDKIFLLVAIVFANAISVGTLLAISAALSLGRDIANNSRASREYLLKLAASKHKQYR